MRQDEMGRDDWLGLQLKLHRGEGIGAVEVLLVEGVVGER